MRPLTPIRWRAGFDAECGHEFIRGGWCWRSDWVVLWTRVLSIHGNHDPHPAEGVQKPLTAVLADFRFVLLERCGHTPWLERQARDEFYRVLRTELV